MILNLICLSLETVSNTISIATPIILLIWFYYSQRQIFSKNYYLEIDGIYAGFTNPINKPNSNGTMYAGIIMKIRDVDSKGYFKGEFNFAEKESNPSNPNELPVMEGLYSFYGKLNFKLYIDKSRNPFKKKIIENMLVNFILSIDLICQLIT